MIDVWPITCNPLAKFHCVAIREFKRELSNKIPKSIKEAKDKQVTSHKISRVHNMVKKLYNNPEINNDIIPSLILPYLHLIKEPDREKEVIQYFGS